MNSIKDIKQLERELGLKYEVRFNFTRALTIFSGMVSVILGLFLFLNKTTPTANFMGLLCLMFFVRLSLGSPFQRELTDESAEKLMNWYLNQKPE